MRSRRAARVPLRFFIAPLLSSLRLVDEALSIVLAGLEFIVLLEPEFIIPVDDVPPIVPVVPSELLAPVPVLPVLIVLLFGVPDDMPEPLVVPVVVPVVAVLLLRVDGPLVVAPMLPLLVVPMAPVLPLLPWPLPPVAELPPGPPPPPAAAPPPPALPCA